MHYNNRHKNGYNFKTLRKVNPALSEFIIKNKYNNQPTIDFSNPVAVKALNLTLLKSEYEIKSWDFPQGYLCPGVPGRVDYIHHLADLLSSTPNEFIHNRNKINVLDIGTGASCIYPILGVQTYNWHFTASDIDPISIKFANKNIESNNLASKIQCRLQPNKEHIFKGVISSGDYFHLTLCNPPFHKSLADAFEGTSRKLKNLSHVENKNGKSPTLNFGGQKAELWCPGGEVAFVKNMIKESKEVKAQVLWFTCLISKKDNLKKIKLYLKKAYVKQIKVINMEQGNKTSRFIAWSFC